MTRDEWLDRFAAAVGVSAPTPEEVDAILGLAGSAARASERTAAPLTCWLAAQAGLDPAQAVAVATSLATDTIGETVTDGGE